MKESSGAESWLIGLQPQLQLIEQHSLRAAAGKLQFVVVEGPMGTGKTALATAVLESLQGWKHYSVTILKDDIQRRGYVGRLLTRRSSLSEASSMEDLIRAGAEVAATTQEPIVTVLEDFQWADDLSAHFPLGGHRFRASYEDFLHMAIREFHVDSAPGWEQVLRKQRFTFRGHQLAAAVRDNPRRAAKELRRLGYAVNWTHEDEEPTCRWDRLTDY